MEEKFLEKIKEVMEIEDRKIYLTDNFRDYEEWSSLANLSLIAMLDEEYGVVLEQAEFRNVKTLGELLDGVKRNMV